MEKTTKSADKHSRKKYGRLVYKRLSRHGWREVYE